MNSHIAPILILGYARVEPLITQIKEITKFQKRNIYISVDKPTNLSKQGENRQLTEALLEFINLKNVSIRFHESHQGLRQNVISSIDWVFSDCNAESIIIIEDDCFVANESLKILDLLLLKYAKFPEIAHISIYNRVPAKISQRNDNSIRFSNYPETYIWATWKDSWSLYNDDIHQIYDKLKIKDIRLRTNSIIGAITWKLHLLDAKLGLVDSWAYRWLGSMWINDKISITSNLNFATYSGYKKGTHHSMFSKKPQIQTSHSSKFINANLPNKIEIDMLSDKWTLTHDANGNFLRIFLKIIQSLGRLVIILKQRGK